MNNRNVLIVCLASTLALVFLLMRGGTSTPSSTPHQTIQALRVEQDFIIRDENQEVEIRFPCPHLSNVKLISFALTEKSCSCMDGETEVDPDGTPVAILKFRLSPNHHKKDGAGSFTAKTLDGEQIVRVQAALNVFPPFWTEPEDIRLITLKGDETERTIRIRAATAFGSTEQTTALAIAPLPFGLELISSDRGTEAHKGVVVHWIDTQIKFTRPVDASGLQSTRLIWKSGTQEYEKVIYWSCSKGIECRPSHLLVSESSLNAGNVNELEFRVVSALDPFKVVSVTCSDAELRSHPYSGELLRQHSVKLGITRSDPSTRRVNLTVQTLNGRAELSEVELPVIFQSSSTADRAIPTESE